MSGEPKFADELRHLRAQLRAREADAKALADRIATLQQRIDAAMSKLGRSQDVTRRKAAHKRVSKK